MFILIPTFWPIPACQNKPKVKIKLLYVFSFQNIAPCLLAYCIRDKILLIIISSDIMFWGKITFVAT